jgi:lysophospholipase L1-like esterase
LTVTNAVAHYVPYTAFMYRFQLFTSTGALVAEGVVPGGTNVTPFHYPADATGLAPGLEYLTPYSWRARAELEATFGPWSSMATFVTADPPPLTVTRFLAFGDSLTEGDRPSESYPSRLELLLSADHPDQSIGVVNAGKSGEKVVDGVDRFRDIVRQFTPEVVLLLDGANDLLARQADAIPDIIASLRRIVRDARARDIRVLLANFPPQNPAGTRGAGALAVPQLNAEIAALAALEGAELVDLYGGLGGTPAGAIGPDGLHPTTMGYQLIAQIWFDAITQVFSSAPRFAPTPQICGPCPR